MDGQQVESLLGKQVQSASGEDMGRIADIIVDKTGQTRAAVIDFGGFLGVGSRKIAVDWKAIHVGQDKVTIDIPRNELRVAPIYKEGDPVVILGRSPEPQQKPAPAAPDAAHPAGTPPQPAK